VSSDTEHNYSSSVVREMCTHIVCTCVTSTTVTAKLQEQQTISTTVDDNINEYLVPALLISRQPHLVDEREHKNISLKCPVYCQQD